MQYRVVRPVRVRADGDEQRRSSSTRSATVARWPARGMQFDYPAIEGVSADLLLVTHEHRRPQRRRGDRRRPGRAPLDGGHARVAGRRGGRGRLRARRGGRHAARPEHDLRLHARRRCGSRTSATSARPRCATSRPPRSGRSTCCSCRSAAARRSAPPRRAAIVEPARRALGRPDALPHASGSASSSRPTRSWSCSGTRSCGWRGRASRRRSFRAAQPGGGRPRGA